MRTTNTERRPLSARHWRISRSLASLLARLQIRPNVISMASVAFGIASGVALADTSFFPKLSPALWVLGALLAGMRLTANMLDGMVAIETNSASPLGELLNEAPDRISDSATLIGLGYALGGNAVLGYVGAIAAMFTAYIRAVGKVAGASQHYCGPMAKPHRMAVVIGVALVSSLIQTNWLPTAGLAVIVVGSAITAARRFVNIAVQLRRSAS